MYKVFHSNGKFKHLRLKCLVDDTNKLLLEAEPEITQYDGYHQIRFIYLDGKLMISEGYSPYDYDEDGKIKFLEFDEYIEFDQKSVHPVLSYENPPYMTVEEYNKDVKALTCEEFEDLATARLFYEVL